MCTEGLSGVGPAQAVLLRYGAQGPPGRRGAQGSKAKRGLDLGCALEGALALTMCVQPAHAPSVHSAGRHNLQGYDQGLCPLWVGVQSQGELT